MGLDTTHNAWHGPYSTFNDFRRELLKAYNGMDLFQFKGFDGVKRGDEVIEYKGLDLFDYVEDDGLILLLNHSDCEGNIRWVDCAVVAESLRKIQSKLSAYWLEKSMQFIIGCLAAYSKKEDLIFG